MKIKRSTLPLNFRTLNEPQGELCWQGETMILNGKKYEFGDCPKCGKRRPLHPDSGLCWLCGRHDLDMAMAEVDPDLKAVLDQLDRRMQLENDPKELIRLILLAEQLSEKI